MTKGFKLSLLLCICAWALYSCYFPYQIVEHSYPAGSDNPDPRYADILNQQELHNRAHLVFIYFKEDIEIDPLMDGNFVTVTSASPPDASRLVHFKNSNNIGLSLTTSWQFPQTAPPVLVIDPKVPLDDLLSDTYTIDLETVYRLPDREQLEKR